MRVVRAVVGQRVQGDGGGSRGQMDLIVGVVASQTQAGRRPERQGAVHGSRAALVGEVQVAGGRSRGGNGEHLAVHPHGQRRVRAQVGQQLVGRGEPLVARPPRRHPVAGVGHGVAGQHEAVRVEGVREGRGHAGRHGALVEGVQRVGRVHHGVVGFEGGGGVVDAGVAVAAAAEMGDAREAQAVGVPAQALHEGRGGGPRERAGARVLCHAEARLRGVHPGDELRRVAGVRPHDGPVVAHVGGGQGEELAGFVGRDGRDATGGAVAGLRGLRFAPLVGGAPVGAAVAAVGVGSGVAGVCVVRTVRAGLAYVGVFFGIAAAAAGGTAVGVRPSTGRVAQFVMLLLLSVSRWGAAARSGAG